MLLNVQAVFAEHIPLRVCATIMGIPSYHTFIHMLLSMSRYMHNVCDASASIRLINVHPACVYGCYKTRRGCPGSILQLLFTIGMTWRMERRWFCTQSSAGSSAPATSCDVHTLLAMALKYHEVGFVVAVLQLCQCATDPRRDWLKLMEGAGLSLIAHTHTRKVDQTVTLLFGFNK